MLRILATLLLAPCTSASRFQADADSHDSLNTSAHSSAWAGQILRGRYRLLAPLPGEKLPHRKVGQFPWGGPLAKERFEGPQRLGRGESADAWRARDVEGQEEVVVKLFLFSEYGTYITRKAVELEREQREVVEKGGKECRLVQEMMAEEGSYPEGKAHVCKCLAAHVDDMANDDDVAFLVLEQCGESVESKLRRQWKTPSPSFLPSARAWMLDVLKAVRFMSGLERPVMHMDLHYGNVAVTEEGAAKLIDFGLARRFDEAAGDVKRHFCAPPEHVWTSGGGLESYPREKAWAYDVWSAGLLYSELMCPKRWMPFRTQDAGVGEGRGMEQCKDSTRGLGEAQDWELVKGAVCLYEERKTPEELMKMLPR